MVKGIVLWIVILLILLAFVPISHGYTENISDNIEQCSILVSNGYIQNLIDEASDGDTIFIPSGIYYENIVIDKSISLVGEDKNTTIIDGGCSEYVLSIVVDWVNISGFTIQCGGMYGINILSKHTIITGNNILNNNHGIFSSYSSSYNIITENTISNNGIGIYLEFYLEYSSSNNIITENNIISNFDGIYLGYSSDNNIITGNNIKSNSRYGIYLDSSSNNNISCNSFLNDGLFIEYPYFSDNKVENNTVNGKPLVYLEYESDKIIDSEVGQVILVNCDNIIVENLNLSYTTAGIELLRTYNCTIKNNDCSNNYYGIYSSGSSGNNINGNKIVSNNRNGMRILSSNDNIITGNDIISNKMSGIYSRGSDGNNFTGDNIITNNAEGIWLISSVGNNITGNKITNNSIGIYPRESDSNKITGNIIKNNSKGLYIFDSDRNNITDNIIVSNTKYGIHVYCYCKNNNITGNEILNNYFSINLDYNSNNHIIIKNNISNNKYGIWISNNNIIKGNIISNNEFGMRMDGSDNIISGNTISNNNDGIFIFSFCEGNIIYHNNFIENTINARDSGNNIWDDGKYGNYWSDYKEKYPFARKILSKGIWNTPYEIEDGDNKDNCPLVKQWSNSASIDIPRDKPNYKSLFLRFLEQFPLLQRLIDVWRSFIE